ncbi:MAG: hypothetical protein QM723_20720 [Myxococcaceae bacterium]
MIQAPERRQESDARDVPFMRISLSNSALLSAMYLGAAVLLELLRRFFGWHWVEVSLKALEAFPMRMLDIVGLNEPLVHAYLSSDIEPWEMRLALGGTTVVVIVLLAVVVGAGMSAVARVGGKR